MQLWVGSTCSADRGADVRPRPVPTNAAGPCATALEDERLRAGVGLWQLYIQTGRSVGQSLADRMTGNGRYAQAPVMNSLGWSGAEASS